MNKTIDNALLFEAFGLYEEKLSARYSGAECFEPSEKFNQKMRKLIKSQSSFYHRATLTRARRAMLAAAIIITLAAASLSVGAIRERIFSFFVTSGSEVDVIEYNNNPDTVYPSTIENAMTPSYLPDGYTLSQKQSSENNSFMYYEKGDDYLTIEQFTKDNYRSATDAEYKTTTRENYEGTDYIIKTDEDMTLLIWERDGYVFEAVGYVATDELLKVAASVK